MGKNYSEIDLYRFSHNAQPVAKSCDANNNGKLEENEYNKFLSIWQSKTSKNTNPLLMQLHIKTLQGLAKEIAEYCDKDEYKGVLTESELQNFLDICEKEQVKNPIKIGTSIKTILTGEENEKLKPKKEYKEKPEKFINTYTTKTQLKLFENWLKLDIINYKGSDKFFHAVGNYEGMEVGKENIVKIICKGQDEDKRKNSPRATGDYTEDMYANWLGREFAKMYPDETPQELFKDLAPKGFDIEESKKPAVKLFIENAIDKDGWTTKKIKQYIGYFKEKYVLIRFLKETLNIE